MGSGDGSGAPARRRSRFGLALGWCAAALAVTWFWFALAVDEVWSDECKARAAGTSDIDLFVVWGVAPLVLVTAGCLLALVLTAPGGPARRLRWGLGATIGASAVAALIAWALSGWTLWSHLAIGANCVV